LSITVQCLVEEESLHFLEKVQRYCETETDFAILSARNPTDLNEELIAQIKKTKEQAGTFLCSSGSSGYPKIIAHKFSAHKNSAAAVNQVVGLKAEDKWLLSLPLCHAGGLSIIWRCMDAGAKVVLRDKSVSLADQILRDEITRVSLVSAQLAELVNEARSLPSLKTIMVGGSSIPADLIAKAIELKLPVVKSYGMTEFASTVTLQREPSVKEDSGEALPGYQIALNPDGEICVKNYSLALGYISEAGLEPLANAEGYFATGDMGVLFGDKLIVNGRKDRMFISGGENIYPEEIEGVMLELDEVETVCVVPVNNEKFGQRPFAFVKGPFEAVSLREKLLQRLPKFKCPDNFERWDGGKSLKPNYAELGKIAALISMN